MNRVNGTTDSAAYTRISFRDRAVSISLQDLRMNAGLGHLEWREPHAGRPARTVFRGIWSKDRPAPTRTRGTEKLMEYKTYLQALPYSDRLEGDRGVTE